MSIWILPALGIIGIVFLTGLGMYIHASGNHGMEIDE
jgi:hypothetical protein